MATASPHPDGHGGLFDRDGDSPSPELFGAAPTEPDNEEKPDEDNNQTIFMTVFFLVLMVLYVGFCAWYRKGKTRRSVGDDDADTERNERRSRQRRENQAVLDESASAATRARENAEEQRKLEERKESIKKSLWLRLIVDDAEAAEGEECIKDCQCDQCRYWKWDSVGENKNSGTADAASDYVCVSTN